MKEKFPNMAKLLKQFRIKNGISQNKLASVLGYKNGQFISNVERGKAGLPLPKQAILHTKYGVPLSDLFEASQDDFILNYETTIRSLV